MAAPDYDEQFPSPEVLAEHKAAWEADPVAMRARILDAAAPDIVSKMKAMWHATSEEAAAFAMIRGEPTVVTGVDLYPCETCFKLMQAAYRLNMTALTAETMFQSIRTYAMCQRRPIWMGERRKWVCDVCMAPMPDCKMEVRWDLIRESQREHAQKLN